MAKTNAPLLSFNRGEVSPLALARVDLERLRLSAEEQLNWHPRMLGPMSLRPGMAHVASTRSDNPAQPIPFVFGVGDTAVAEVTDSYTRILIDDTVLTRPSVTTTIGAISTFTVTGGTSGIFGGALWIWSTSAGGKVIASKTISVTSGNRGVEHALRFKISLGAGTFRVGTASGLDDVFPSAAVGQGYHSMAFTPSSGGTTLTLYVQFEATTMGGLTVDSIAVESAGAVEIPSPWAVSDLDYLRWEQSGDVLYVCDGTHRPQKIQRWDPRSWSVAQYVPLTGPFQIAPSRDKLTLTPSATSGIISITSDRAFFSSDMAGSLMRITSEQQIATKALSASDTYTAVWTVEGSGEARRFWTGVTGTWVGTITLQRSFIGPDTGFVDVDGWSYTTNTTTASGWDDFGLDTFDFQTVWYRIGFKAGDHTSGTANVSFWYGAGGGDGLVYLYGINSATNVSALVIDRADLKSTNGTTIWAEGLWSDKNGWPSAVAMHEGRLWWFGHNHENASVSDDYENFDDTTEGDSGPLDRTLGYGPVNYFNWAVGLGRLVLGTTGSEVSIRSSSQDDPITPTNFAQRDASTQGSSPVPAVKIDNKAIYVQASRQRLMQLMYGDNGEYRSTDLSRITPDLAGKNGSIVRLAVARQPDTRVFGVRSDGQMVVLLLEPDEEVVCFTRWETDGIIENVYTLPDDEETRVYLIVARTIGGVTKRFHERVALESNCGGTPDAHLSDCHVVYAGSSTTTITGLSHLNGKSVVAWGYGAGDSTGRDLGSYTVSGGSITLTSAVTHACVGLPYTARFKSAKLAYGAQLGTALAQPKILNSLALILYQTHHDGIQFGSSYDKLDKLPRVIDGATVADNTMLDSLDRLSYPLPGQWSTDSRLCLQAASPRPCTVLAAVPSVTTHEKS
jgi:hypothetical protein